MSAVYHLSFSNYNRRCWFIQWTLPMCKQLHLRTCASRDLAWILCHLVTHQYDRLCSPKPSQICFDCCQSGQRLELISECFNQLILLAKPLHDLLQSNAKKSGRGGLTNLTFRQLILMSPFRSSISPLRTSMNPIRDQPLELQLVSKINARRITQ